MYSNYKISQAIRVRYMALNKETGLTDLKLTATDPGGVDDASITFTEIGGGIYEASFTPDATGWWSARVSSVLKPKNVYSQNYFVGTEVDLYPSQENGKLTSLDTKVGEVQTTPTANTVLARLKDICDKLVLGISVTLEKIKIWDGTNTAIVDAQGRLYVYIPPSQQNITIQIAYDRIITPVAATQWNDMVNYTVPTGYDFNCIQFDASDAVNNGKARAITKQSLGTFVLSTNIFTDGTSYTLPRYASKLSVLVTTLIGSTNSTITITYTNEKNQAGRTTTAILKSNAVGERIEFTLQSGDVGVIDVTNVSCSFVEAGAITIEGNISLFYEILTTTGVQYSSTAPLSSIVVPQNEILYLQYNPSNGAAAIRRVSVIGSLVPR
jgi:hypothetical protein